VRRGRAGLPRESQDACCGPHSGAAGAAAPCPAVAGAGLAASSLAAREAATSGFSCASCGKRFAGDRLAPGWLSSSCAPACLRGSCAPRCSPCPPMRFAAVPADAAGPPLRAVAAAASAAAAWPASPAGADAAGPPARGRTGCTLSGAGAQRATPPDSDMALTRAGSARVRSCRPSAARASAAAAPRAMTAAARALARVPSAAGRAPPRSASLDGGCAGLLAIMELTASARPPGLAGSGGFMLGASVRVAAACAAAGGMSPTDAGSSGPPAAALAATTPVPGADSTAPAAPAVPSRPACSRARPAAAPLASARTPDAAPLPRCDAAAAPLLAAGCSAGELGPVGRRAGPPEAEMEAKRDAPAPPPDSLPPGDRGCRTLAPARTPRARGAGRAAGADVDGSPCSLSGRAAAAGRGAASSCASSARTARSSRSSFGCSCSSVPTCARRARPFPGHASRPVELSCMSASGLQRTAHGCKRTVSVGLLALCKPVLQCSSRLSLGQGRGRDWAQRPAPLAGSSSQSQARAARPCAPPPLTAWTATWRL